MNNKARLTIKTKASGITRTGSVLQINIDAGADGRSLTYLIAEDNVIKSGDDSAAWDGSNDEDFESKANWTTGFKKTAVHSVYLDAGDEETAKRIEKLVALKKNRTKDTTDNFFQISIKEIKRKDTNPESSELDNATNVNAITLAKNAYVDGDFDIDKNFDIFDHKRNAYDDADEKYEADVTKLDELETLLSTLKTDYATDLKTAANIQIDIDKLEKYKDTVAATPAETEIERAIYDLDAWGGGKIYKNQVDQWVSFLTEAKKWVENAKFTKVEQILKANANGFVLEGTLKLLDDFSGTGVTRTITDLNDIKDGKYKGFDITEGAEVGAADNGTTFNPANLAQKNVRSREIFGKNANSDGTRYRVAINNFRANNSSDKYFGHTNYAEISDLKKLRGFQPGDIRVNGTHTTHGTGTGFDYGGGTKITVTTEYNDDKTSKTQDDTTTYADLTKRCFDILNLANDGVDNTDAIIRKAFTENDFAEVDGKTPSEHLEMYWKVIRADLALALIHVGTDDLTYDQVMKLKHDNPTTDPTKYAGNTKTKIELLDKLVAAHKYTEEFINDVFVNRPTNKAGFNAWKAKVEKYRTKEANNEVWKNQLVDFWNDKKNVDKTLGEIISKVETSLNDSPTGGFKKVAELEKAISDNKNNENIKKIYEEFKKLSDSTTPKKTDDLFTALDALIKELKKTNPGGDTPKTWKSNLNGSDDQKAAWKFVNDHTKGVDEYKPNGWADKVADAEIKKLTDAIKLAEDEIKKEGDKAVTDVDIKNQESIKTAEEIGKLFKLCNKAHGTVLSSEWEKLKTDLKVYKDATSGEKQAAWTQVNKYKKTGDTKNYADESLDKAEKGEDKRSKDWKVMIEKETVQDAYTYAKSVGFDKDDRARGEAAVALKKESSDEGKLLHKAFSLEGVSKYSDSKDKLDESLTEIKKHIEALEKLIKAKDTETDTMGQIKKKLKEIESVDSEFKVDTFLSNWKSKLEARKTELETKKKNEKNNNEEDGNKPKPWWKEWYGILGILAGIALVVGLVAYFIRSNSSEENEGESE